jgi:ABC-type amino acid transport system permease subunit
VVRVIAGWLVAAAVASLVALALLIGAGCCTRRPTAANTWWSMVAIAIGFFAGGFFAGFRALQAPILHAVGIGLTSLGRLVPAERARDPASSRWTWPTMTPQFAVAVLLLQIVAAIVGALLGYNIALRGKPGLSEHEPI